MKCFCRARWLKSALLASERRDSLLTTPLSAKHTPAPPPLPNPLLEPGKLSRCFWFKMFLKPCITAEMETMWHAFPGNRVAKPRSAERCTAWKRGTCGAQRAAGRRPASASLTELHPLPHFKTCSFTAAVPRTERRCLSEWASWAEMCPSEACGLFNVTDSSRPQGVLFSYRFHSGTLRLIKSKKKREKKLLLHCILRQKEAFLK